VTYLLDTNVCVALINGRPAKVRQQLERTLAGPNEAVTSSIVLFELWYGVGKSARIEANAARLNTFLAGPVGRLDFDEEDAQEAGNIRARLESLGKPIGAYDLLIAGQARRRGATLVTANTDEFGSVPELKWEDWAG
jgi:tRNA(fMet)-specific endonuclease VapC